MISNSHIHFRYFICVFSSVFSWIHVSKIKMEGTWHWKGFFLPLHDGSLLHHSTAFKLFVKCLRFTIAIHTLIVLFFSLLYWICEWFFLSSVVFIRYIIGSAYIWVSTRLVKEKEKHFIIIYFLYLTLDFVNLTKYTFQKTSSSAQHFVISSILYIPSQFYLFILLSFGEWFPS